MSYRVGTPNYNLPQTEGTDKRDWFDTNEAFRNVDVDLHAVVEQSGSQSAVIEALQTDIGNLQTGLEDTNTEVSGIKTKQATDEENIAQNAQAISQLNTKVESLDTDLAEMIEVTEEESATASVQHNVGDYFRYNNNLWITTVLIRVGDEIVPNVNCETTDVMTRVYNLEHSGGGSISADAVSFDNTGTDLVSQNVEAAIKEVNAKTGGTVIDDSTTSTSTTWSSQKISGQIGNLTNLETTDKSSVVGAVNEVKTGLAKEYEKSASGVDTYAVKCNDIVILEIILLGANITAGTDIITLDSDIKPASNKSTLGIIEIVTGGVGTVQSANFVIDTNGAIQCTGNITNGYAQIVAIYKTA